MSKKILYIVNHLKFHGGIERLISQKIDAWQELYGYEVSVIAMNQEGQPIIYPPKNDFSFTDLKLSRVNQYHPVDLIKFVSKLKKIFKKENPDLIISTLTGLPSLLLPLIPSKGRKVLEIHTMGGKLVSPSWKYKWWFLKKYDYVVLLSEDERKFYKLNNLIVIPNFLSLNEEIKPNYLNRKNVIIAAGRISEQKQFMHAIKIWERIFKKHPDWHFDIYGDGDHKLLAEYRNYIKTHKIERLTFHPSTNKLMSFFKESSIYCMTSDHECFPMVLLECKTAMLPVVSYNLPNGPSRIISDDGMLVKNKDIAQFADVLSNLISDENKRREMAENAWKNRVNFSSEIIMKKWRNLI